jgi:hypothetical protein
VTGSPASRPKHLDPDDDGRVTAMRITLEAAAPNVELTLR